MSDFSSVFVDPGCALFPRHAWGQWFQSKDFPDHETETACIGGTVRSDGLFIRNDDRCNPSLAGWIGMRSCIGAPDMFLCIRFSRGKVVEALERKMSADITGPRAWDSPADWREVPLTIA